MSDLMRFLVSTFESKCIHSTGSLSICFSVDSSRTNSNASNGNSNGTVFEVEAMDTWSVFFFLFWFPGLRVYIYIEVVFFIFSLSLFLVSQSEQFVFHYLCINSICRLTCCRVRVFFSSSILRSSFKPGGYWSSPMIFLAFSLLCSGWIFPVKTSSSLFSCLTRRTTQASNNEMFWSLFHWESFTQLMSALLFPVSLLVLSEFISPSLSLFLYPSWCVFLPYSYSHDDDKPREEREKESSLS